MSTDGPTNDVPDETQESVSAARGRWPLHWKILVGLLLGAVLGVTAHAWAARRTGETAEGDGMRRAARLEWVATNVAEPVGRIFLRLVLMVVVPLVFSALALAVVELGDLGKLGRIGLRTLIYTVAFSSLAAGIGVSLVNLVRPGESLSPEKRAVLAERYQSKAADSISQARRAKPWKDVLVDLVPENPLQEMAGALDGSSKGNGILAVMVFALVFGAALVCVPQQGQPLVRVLEGLLAVSMTIIGFAMRLAPLGVGCLVFTMTSRLGGEILWTLVGFVGTVFAGFAIQLFVVYPLFLVLAGRNPTAFFRRIGDAMLMAFGTSSSNATLPTTLRVAQENLGVPSAVARFVLTVGATGNQNGTGLYEGVVVLFLAQVFGVDLGWQQQIAVVLAAVLGGIGTAGVPGGSIPMVVVVLQSVGVPGDSIAIILGIDRFLDMCRTVLNVTGDLVVAACVGPAEV